MGDNGIYKGAEYKFEYGKNDPFTNSNDILATGDYRTRASQFGLTTDPRTANQLKEVSDKLSTGAKTIELTGITPAILESIPKQQFDEIRRLKKLVGADITFHGPLIEPTGIKEGGWDEASRKQAERQIFDAVARSHALNPEKGENTIVTLHTSNGLPAPKIRMKQFNKETGEMEDTVTNIAIINENTGEMGYLPKRFIGENKLLDKKGGPMEGLNRLNEDSWDSKVSRAAIELQRAEQHINTGISNLSEFEKENKDKDVDLSEIYVDYKKEPEKYSKIMEAFSKDKNIPVEAVKKISAHMHILAQGEGYLHDSYRDLQELFGEAYSAAEKMGKDGEEQLKKLEEYKKNAAKNLKKWYKDPSKLQEFAEEVGKGVEICREIKPQLYRPIEEFAIEKAAETFGNVALNSFQEYGESSPILSLENPPTGSGLSRADEIRDLVKATRKHFVNKATNLGILDKEEAEKQAEKLIGVTWDVGHINMMRKYGYDDKDLENETKTIKPFVKHIHLSDNFGLEHTELPMGMGNVPMKEHLKALGEKAEKAKQIIETGGPWYEHFRTSPLPEVMHAMGSPIYPMHMQPYWNQASGMSGVPGYFGGYGLNPEQHHAMYGSGFSGLPTELGGSIQGRGSRLAGTPME